MNLTVTETAHIAAVQLGVFLDEIREEHRLPSALRERWTTFGALIQNAIVQLREDSDPANADLAKRATGAPTRSARLMPAAEPGTNIVRLFPTMSASTEASTDSASPDLQPA